MRILARFTLAAVLVTAAFLTPVAAHAATAPTKIMPLGDSITWGVGSPTSSSYRAPLWTMLVRQFGYNIDFVGSGQSGSLPDPDNEGHSGWRIDQIAASFNGWAATYQPSIVTLHIGTNDMNQNYQVSTAPDRLGALIDQITAQLPQATVVVASIVPALDATLQARINTFNAAIPGLVAARANAGKKVRYVNMASLSSTDLADNLHPNDAGYLKMAQIWAPALASVLNDGRDAPVFTSGFELGAGTFPGDTATSWSDSVVASLNVGGYCCALTAMEASPRQELARGGVRAFMYSGNDASATQSYSYARIFDVHIPVTASTELSYWLYPQQVNGTYTAVDLLFTDGTALRDSAAVDQFGVRLHPQFQGQGGHLAINQWNRVRSAIGASVAGKIIDQIRFGYDQPQAIGPFRGYLDEVSISEKFTAYVGEDLALRRPVTGSAPCAATEPATAAVDGTTAANSKWCSAAASKQLVVDLGASKALRRFIVRHAGAGGEAVGLNTPNFTIATSQDNVNWTPAASITSNVDSVTLHQLGATVNARYVRLEVTSGIARIFSFEVYGA